MALRLRDNVHWCNASGKVVFLDLEAGRYFSLPGAANQAFLHIAEGAGQAEDQNPLSMLMRRGRLIEDGECGSIQLSASIDEPTSDFPFEPHQRANLIHLGRELAL